MKYFETSVILAKSIYANMDKEQFEYEFDSDKMAFINYCVFGAREIASDSDTKFIDLKKGDSNEN
jgi:hypothetical protein